MLGVQLAFDPAGLISKLREKGLLTVGAAGQTLRILPPLTIKEEQVVKALEILDSCLKETAP